MIEKEVVIQNKYGLHARPSAAFVQAASQFESEIILINEDRIANGKSIISLMVLAAESGARITLKVDGSDETEAMDTLVRLVENKFNIKEEDL
jgi:phosphocarrier protein